MNANDPPLEVGELLAAVNGILAAQIGECAVRGTLSGWRIGRGFGWGELLEETHDGRGYAARIPVAVPLPIVHAARRALATGGTELADGAELVLHGRLDVHPHFGPLRLLAEDLTTTSATGPAVQTRRRLLAELDQSGLLRANGSLPIPLDVERIGVVAPVTGGAGRADFVGRLTAAGLPFRIIEQRAAMQGPAAPAEIARAIGRLTGEAVELIVVLRGGGATSDLVAFDSEPVARAIALSPQPVVMAVGHSVNRTVADDVAHTTVATPTAAAEWLLDRRRTTTTVELSPAIDDLPTAPPAWRTTGDDSRVRRAYLTAAIAVTVAVALALLLVLR